MNRHHTRLILGFVISILVLTALFLLLNKTALAITAYCFSLLAPVMFFGTLLLIASGTKNKYITNAAFPLQAHTYSVLNLIVCVLFVWLEQSGVWRISAGWFTFIHIVLLALLAWRFLAMDAGQEEIERVEKNVKLKTADWRLLGADVETLKNNAPSECRKSLQEVCDAIRYADPMTGEALESCTEEIRCNLQKLLKLSAENQTEEFKKLAETLKDQIRLRNVKCMMLK